jgi:hypothetical protein
MNYAKHFSVCQDCIRCLQIGRRECDELWRDKNPDLPCNDCFRKFIELDKEFIQPDRSKREDLHCCKDLEIVQRAITYVHEDRCGYYYGKDCVGICVDLRDLCKRYKMRCSEHCGNTVRDK